MASKFDICSQALIDLGEDTISSFTANTPASKICGAIYPDYIKYLLSIHPWRFTIKKVQLARLTAEPLNRWKYAYQLPSDILLLKTVYDNDNVGAIPFHRYEIYEDNLLTDEEKIYIDYQFQILEEDFPNYFIEFAVKAIASKIALAITDDTNIAQLKKIEAFGNPSDNLNGGEFSKAKRLDSVQNTTSMIVADDLIAARFS